MALQSGRLIGRISSFVASGVFFGAAIIVGLIPYSEGGYSGLCPSAIVSMTKGMTTGQSVINFLSSGRCTSYASTMTIIMVILLVLAVIALVAAILMLRRRNAAAAFPANYSTGAPAQPAHAPAGAWQSPAAPQGSGTFDTKLLLVGLAAVAGVVLVSFLVDWLAFLPGIIELLLWAAAGVTIIWQIKRSTAGTDEEKLAEAEAWNPAVVARNLVTAGQNRLEVHRAERRQAERAAQANATPPAPAESEFRGDDGIARPNAQ